MPMVNAHSRAHCGVERPTVAPTRCKASSTPPRAAPADTATPAAQHNKNYPESMMLLRLTYKSPRRWRLRAALRTATPRHSLPSVAPAFIPFVLRDFRSNERQIVDVVLDHAELL